MIISKTPVRISLWGGGTDYPEWFMEHGGATFGMSIDKYCYITVRKRPANLMPKYKLCYNELEYTDKLSEIKHPAIKACLKYVGIKEGIELHHWADVPSKRGMGTSSAFVVGLLNALYNLVGQEPTKEELAQKAIIVERDLLHETVGCQDQYLCALGGINNLLFDAAGVFDYGIPNIKFPAMLFDIAMPRIASVVAKAQITSMAGLEESYRELLDIVDEGVSAWEAGDIYLLGKLLASSWRIKKSLSPIITNDKIDAIYEKAIEAGAYGGKLLGAGAGGFMLFVVPQEKQGAVKKALSGYSHLPFEPEFDGTRIIYRDES